MKHFSDSYPYYILLRLLLLILFIIIFAYKSLSAKKIYLDTYIYIIISIMIFLDVHYIMILFIIEKYLSYTSDFTLPIQCGKSSGGHPITCFFFPVWTCYYNVWVWMDLCFVCITYPLVMTNITMV